MAYTTHPDMGHAAVLCLSREEAALLATFIGRINTTQISEILAKSSDGDTLRKEYPMIAEAIRKLASDLWAGGGLMEFDLNKRYRDGVNLEGRTLVRTPDK